MATNSSPGATVRESMETPTSSVPGRHPGLQRFGWRSTALRLRLAQRLILVGANSRVLGCCAFVPVRLNSVNAISIPNCVADDQISWLPGLRHGFVQKAARLKPASIGAGSYLSSITKLFSLRSPGGGGWRAPFRDRRIHRW